MKTFLTLLTATTLALLAVTLPVSAGQLDDYYLNAYSEQPVSGALQKAVLLPPSETTRTAHCGTPLKHGLQRDWDKLATATQKTLAKQLAAPVLAGEATVLSSRGHFIIHYATTSSPFICQNRNSPNLSYTFDDIPAPLSPLTIQSWVQTVGDTFEQVYDYYTGQGYALPPNFPTSKYNIYLRSLACDGIYGQTTTAQSAPSAGFANAYTSFIEIDNNFTDAIYHPLTYTPTQSLQITAAHEYHHAVQYGYNIFRDVWFAEATSTWMEDELYDGVNQLYNYLPAWFSNSSSSLDRAVDVNATTTGAGYSRWIFNRYLAERYSRSGTDVMLAAWERLAAMNSPGGNADIPMVPVLEGLLMSAPFSSSLGDDFFGFTRRVYLRDWTSHTADISRIHPYSADSIVTSYPATMNASVPHYAFSYIKFTPATTVATLSITINKTSGIRTALFKKAGGSISEVTAGSDGSYTVASFGSLNAAQDEVVLLAANTTSLDNHQISFSTNSTPAPVSEPLPTPASAGGGGGGGCFIATAAYGSYLHPQVHLLRQFRDRQLLTNGPGRAFVALYYHFSPPLADFIARHEALRTMTRLALTPLILAVVHPAAASILLLTALGLAYLPLRRRLQLQIPAG